MMGPNFDLYVYMVVAAIVLIVVFLVFALWRIFDKAGLGGGYAFLIFIPLPGRIRFVADVGLPAVAGTR